MPEHHYFGVRGRKIGFHIYVDVPDSRARVDGLMQYFERLPDRHLDVLYPFFAMEHKPGGRDGGGTWRHHEVQAQLLGPRHESHTHIPSADIQTLVLDRRSGMMGCSKDRWSRDPSRLPATVFHEVGHCVDALGLIPRGASIDDYPGMTDCCCAGHGPLTQRVVEAYARAIYNPAAIFHVLPPGARASEVNQRLLGMLRDSPAFQGVPDTWPPPMRRRH